MCIKGKEISKLLVKYNKNYLYLKNNFSYFNSHTPSLHPFHKRSPITLFYYNNKCNFNNNKCFIRYLSNSCYLQSTNYLESNYF